MGIHKESSHSLAFSAEGTGGLEELIHGLFYKGSECSEWPEEKKQPNSIGTDDP